MDKNRIIVYVTLIILFCSLLFASLSTAECVILIIAAFLIIGVTERAYYYFIRANRIYSREDRSRYPEAMKYYKKTLAAGISPKYTVLTATILIQEGEKVAGQAALEKLIAKKGFKDQVLLSQAKCALSLAFYVDKDYERALSLCEEVLETDYRDNVLYINTCTYYLALNRTKDFKKLVEDFSRTRVTSLALLDLQVVYQMLRGEWDSAYRMLSSLFEKAESFSFADPYVHMAQIHIHCGQKDEALNYLRQALENVRFRPVTIISEETVRGLVTLLEDEGKAHAAMVSIDSNPVTVFNGHIPEIKDDKNHVFLNPALLDKPAEDEKETRLERLIDDASPDTDLNDEDEAWLKAHSSDD